MSVADIIVYGGGIVVALLMLPFVVLWIHEKLNAHIARATIKKAILHSLWYYPGINSQVLELYLHKGIRMNDDVYDVQMHRLINAGVVKRAYPAQLFLSKAAARRIAAECGEDDVESAVKLYRTICITQKQLERELCDIERARWNAMTTEELRDTIQELARQWEASRIPVSLKVKLQKHW
jgi:hypothetical protein